ncbi:hypothetical protein EG341_00995 [Chryseobacterium lactis]|nr:hypothetical protein EG341_00995 [Chryseobacterium lactis]
MFRLNYSCRKQFIVCLKFYFLIKKVWGSFLQKYVGGISLEEEWVFAGLQKILKKLFNIPYF